MPWNAKPGCAEHHMAAVERAVNLLPPAGEVFDSLDHCNRRLRGYALAEAFDIVRKGGGTKSKPSWRQWSTFAGLNPAGLKWARLRSRPSLVQRH
jgi:hypothetical protein